MGVGVNDLPDLALEIVFSYLNQYDDLDSVRMVNRRWNRITRTVISIVKKAFLRCNHLNWRLYEPEVKGDSAIAKRCSHSSCYHDATKKVYIFGGCTDNYTAFNDLWSFDLRTHSWCREIIKCAPFPRPKAMSIFVPYKEYLILHGGFAKSSPNPIHQAANFYSEIHMYDTITNEWIEVETTPSSPTVASHCACLVDDSLIIFGGSHNSRATNAVYVLDIPSKIWHMPAFDIPSEMLAYGSNFIVRRAEPSPRYGSSCVLIDKSHLLVVGGCGGPNCIYNDAWLLIFDLTMKTKWEWKHIDITNPKFGPVQLWCHPACPIGRNLAFIGCARKNDNEQGYNTTSLNSHPAPLQVKPRNPVQMPPPTNSVPGRSTESRDSTLNESMKLATCQPSASSSHPENNVQREDDDDASDPALRSCCYGYGYGRRHAGAACIYILDTSRVLLDHTVTWRQQAIDSNAPDDTILYSLCAGRGELIMFGGMRSDVLGGNGNPFMHAISHDIYLLSPTNPI